MCCWIFSIVGSTALPVVWLNGNTNVDSSFVTKSIGPPSFISMSISSTVFEPLLVLLFNL